MSKKKKQSPSSHGRPTKRFPWLMLAPVLLIAGIVVAVQLRKHRNGPPPTRSTPTVPAAVASNASAQAQANAQPAATAPTNAPTIGVNEAVMVTVELDFEGTIPTIAEALTQIERRYYPRDGVGRTFAILDAYGNPTADNKLHISMHVSTEKPGKGLLIFKRTGEVLWENTITGDENTAGFTGKNLLILVDNGEGKGRSWTIDGSSNPRSILDTTVKEKQLLLRELWPDGTEREFTYLYSACGCPVKAMVRRQGEGTFRTSDQPVMFPDDPDALRVIHSLMGW